MRVHIVAAKSVTYDILAQRRVIWDSKPIIRRLYSKWYGLIKKALKPGRTLELGGGSGNLRDFLPWTISTDIVFAPWLDAVMDAQALPLKEESLDNILLFDVLHHLATPSFFFHEIGRTLKRKGRVVMIEPYVSWLSYPVYRFLHAEGMKSSVDPFQERKGKNKEPFQGNQAIPTLIFEKCKKHFLKEYPLLRVIEIARMDILLYPLSGGFHHPSLCPRFLWQTLESLEKLLRPLNRIMAFRLFIVLEKE